MAMGRSAGDDKIGDPDGVVVDRSCDSRRKISRQRHGVLTTAKSSDAFCDEGGVVRKRSSH